MPKVQITPISKGELVDLKANPLLRNEGHILALGIDDIAAPINSLLQDYIVNADSFCSEFYVDSSDVYHKLTIIDLRRCLPSKEDNEVTNLRTVIVDEAYPNHLKKVEQRLAPSEKNALLFDDQTAIVAPSMDAFDFESLKARSFLVLRQVRF